MEECYYCGQVFNGSRHLQRHLHDKQCPEQESSDSESNTSLNGIKEILDKRTNAADLEEEGIRFMYKRARELNEEYLQAKREQYQEKQFSQERIEEKLEKLTWRIFKENWAYTVIYMYYLCHGPKTQELLNSIEDKNNAYHDVFSKLYRYKTWVHDLIEDDISENDDDETDSDDNNDL